MARGTAELAPLEMTKWFDTNYHYLVPELEPGLSFQVRLDGADRPLSRKPWLWAFAPGRCCLGPISFLLLGKGKVGRLKPLRLVEKLAAGLRGSGPAAGPRRGRLGADRRAGIGPGPAGRSARAMESAYGQLAAASVGFKICLATYFGELRDNLAAALRLPVAAVHLDLVRAPEQLDARPGADAPGQCSRWA